MEQPEDREQYGTTRGQGAIWNNQRTGSNMEQPEDRGQYGTTRGQGAIWNNQRTGSKVEQPELRNLLLAIGGKLNSQPWRCEMQT
jgi:hypothetical protein